jgi:hypothetical protein
MHLSSHYKEIKESLALPPKFPPLKITLLSVVFHQGFF